MAYGLSMLGQIEVWIADGAIPHLNAGDLVVDLGSQMINADTPHTGVAKFIRTFDPGFDEELLSSRFPSTPHYYAYMGEVWALAGLDYFSYDIPEAPRSRVFDLNFHDVSQRDCGAASLVLNIGTTEHIINQFNCFKVVHDLLRVGGVAIHQVPFAGMLNHCLFNYQPKFFVSLIINNGY